jgi:hypothetical protein
MVAPSRKQREKKTSTPQRGVTGASLHVLGGGFMVLKCTIFVKQKRAFR